VLETDIRSFLIGATLLCRAKVDVPVTCLTSWAAPFTGGYQRILPRGEIVRIANDPPTAATAVYAYPQAYRRLHRQMVPLGDRLQFWVYRGYHLCIELSRVATDFELIGTTRV
jgi:hypothetical protein